MRFPPRRRRIPHYIYRIIYKKNIDDYTVRTV
jgi:hypothetical protein